MSKEVYAALVAVSAARVRVASASMLNAKAAADEFAGAVEQAIGAMSDQIGRLSEQVALATQVISNLNSNQEGVLRCIDGLHGRLMELERRNGILTHVGEG